MARPLNEYDTEYTALFKKRDTRHLQAVDGSLSPEQFAYALTRFGLNHNEAGAWLGLNSRQGRRYATGELEIPIAVSKLVTLMMRLGLKPEQV